MKIKRFLLMIIMILSIVVGYFLYKNFNNNLCVRYHSYQDYVGIMEDKETIPISVAPNDNAFSHEEFVDQMIEFNKEGTFVILYGEPDDIYRKFQFIVYSHNQALIDDLTNHQAKGLRFDNRNEAGYYASDLDDEMATDHIEIINNDLFLTYREKVEIMPVKTGIEKMQERQNASAEFWIFFYSDTPPKEFDEKFTAFLKESGLNRQISYTNWYGNYTGAQIEILMDDGIQNIELIIISLLAIYILFMVIDIYRKKKTIMIQNMHGISLFKIVSRLLIKMLIIHFIIFVLGLMISMTLWTNGKVYQEKELLEQLKTVIAMMAGGYMVIFITTYIISYLLLGIKNIKRSENSVKNLLMISLIKIVFLIIISSGLIEMIGETYQDVKQYLFFIKYEDVLENLGQINLFYPGPDDPDKVFDYYLKNDGYFADFSIYEGNTYAFLKETFGDVMDEEELQETALEYPVIYANVNYIESYDRPIYKSDGTRLDLHEIKENVMLVPENCSLTDFTKYNRKVNGEADIIRIKDSGMYFDYTYNAENLIYREPILYVVTESNYFLREDFLTIPLNKVSEKEIVKKVEELTHKEARVESGKEKMTEWKYNIRIRLIDTGTILILYLLIYGSIVYQSIYIYVEEFKKNLIVQYLFGKKKTERYRSLFIFDIIVYMIPLGYCLLMQHLPLIDLLKLYCITYLGEVIIMYFMMHRIEKGNVAIVLKGESQL